MSGSPGRGTLVKLMTMTMTRTVKAFPCLVLVALVGCSAPPPDESGWLETLVQHRERMDQFHREDPSSPIPVERRGALLPINYYAPDSAYRVPAALEVSLEQQIFDVPYSTGEIFPMQRVGVLKFALNGEPRSLAALAEAPVRSIESLFIMFKDSTNGSETYGGGRYIELPRTATGHYDLDFNRAFHPNCYYDEVWECPVPPRENWLPVPVPAGERLAPGFDPGYAPTPTDTAPPDTPQSQP
jgi:uncharacterized protein (DUF1684 family)